MPAYDFKCKKCGERFTVTTSIEERKNVTCPNCQSRDVVQILTGCAVNTGSCGSGAGGG